MYRLDILTVLPYFLLNLDGIVQLEVAFHMFLCLLLSFVFVLFQCVYECE